MKLKIQYMKPSGSDATLNLILDDMAPIALDVQHDVSHFYVFGSNFHQVTSTQLHIERPTELLDASNVGRST